MAVASATGSPPGPGTFREPEWPACGSRRPIFLIDASSTLEKRLLEDWIERHRPEGLTSSAYDQNFYRRNGLRGGVYFDRETYGVDRLVPYELVAYSRYIPVAPSTLSPHEAVAQMPLSEPGSETF